MLVCKYGNEYMRVTVESEGEFDSLGRFPLTVSCCM